jgi:hypothetical protein
MLFFGVNPYALDAFISTNEDVTIAYDAFEARAKAHLAFVHQPLIFFSAEDIHCFDWKTLLALCIAIGI